MTKSIDRLDFHHAIPVGALVTCLATVDFVGNSSMSISVQVYSENIASGARTHTHTARVVFVAIDRNHKPSRVPRLIPETAEEQARYDAAKAQYEARRA